MTGKDVSHVTLSSSTSKALADEISTKHTKDWIIAFIIVVVVVGGGVVDESNMSLTYQCSLSVILCVSRF